MKIGEIFEMVLYGEAYAFILVRMALLLGLTLLASRLLTALSGRLVKNKLHYRFIFNIIKVMIYVIGIVFCLDQVPNFNRAFSTLLAGSGIAALTVGLAAQESLGNFINGMVISASKPFEVGDRVHLIGGGITGYIEDITMRHTVVRTFLNSRVIVPNSVINKDMIENSNFLEDRVSGFVDAIITYDSDMEQARALMAAVIEGHPDFVDTRGPDELDQPKVLVYVRGLSVYGVELRASMWTASINTNFGACSEARRQIKHAFDRAGIRFATGVLAPPPS